MISVVIPVYDAAPYLERCIRSLLDQTRPPDELIFVNDGSTDGSMDILIRHAAENPHIRVLTRPNRGVSAARNAGLDVARGDCLYFMDADDSLHPQALEFAARALEETGRDFVLFDFTELPVGVHTRDLPRYDAPTYELWDRPLADFAGSPSTVASVWRFLYRRTTLAGRRFVRGLIFEDVCFTANYLLESAGGVYLPLPFYIYVQTPGSLTRHPIGLITLQYWAWLIRHLAAACRGRRWALRAVNRAFVVPGFKWLRKQILPRKGPPRDPRLAAALRAMFGALMAEKAILLTGFSLHWKLWLLRQRFARHSPEVAGFPTPDSFLTR